MDFSRIAILGILGRVQKSTPILENPSYPIWWLFMLFSFKVSNSNVIKAVSEGLMAQIGRA
jgi:hypothetical protein